MLLTHEWCYACSGGRNSRCNRLCNTCTIRKLPENRLINDLSRQLRQSRYVEGHSFSMALEHGRVLLGGGQVVEFGSKLAKQNMQQVFLNCCFPIKAPDFAIGLLCQHHQADT